MRTADHCTSLDSTVGCTYLTSLPPCAKLPKVAVSICKNENSADTSSGSSILFVSSGFCAISGTLLEFGDNVAETIFSKLTVLSTLSMSAAAILFVELLLLLHFVSPLLCTLPENIVVFDMGITTSLACVFDWIRKDGSALHIEIHRKTLYCSIHMLHST